jgi:AraC-like DNA-binding protein
VHAHTSPRTFARWFSDTTGTTPYNWLLRQRVQLAQHLLETSDLPVDLIAKNTGLSDAGNLRKHFARQLHTTPAAYRKAFRGGAAFSSARNRLLAFAPLQGATRLVAHTEMSCVPTAVRRTAS